MDIIYSKADYADIDEIDSLIKSAIAVMHSYGIEQWDEIYPTSKDFRSDISLDSLYKGCIDGRIAVVFALNDQREPEYLTADWLHPDVKHTVLHRFCVHPDFQNKGVGSQTLVYMESFLSSRGIHAIRMDAFSENPFALSMYSHAGYRITGYADWRKGHFVLMEKYF